MSHNPNLPLAQTILLPSYTTDRVVELSSKLLGLSSEDTRNLLNTMLIDLGGQTLVEQMIHLQIILANFQSLKLMVLADQTGPVSYKESYINMYSKVQGVMRRWLNTLKDINKGQSKSVELIYTFNHLSLTPPPMEKDNVQNGRRYNNLKHGLRSKTLELPPEQ